MDYKSAGVDIDKAEKLIENVKNYAKTTYINGVLGGVGGFGALFKLGKYKNPVLVSSTDGIGTKILIAEEMEKYSGLGYDLVAMCVDDVVCCGAKPLFFLDYIALGKLKEEVYLKFIESVSKACTFAECSLIGGETAELPGIYPENGFDMAGFAVGVVEKNKILNSEKIKEGDTVIGLASSGFHSNGFSLVRKVIRDCKLDLRKNYGFGILGNILLTPTEIYSPVLLKAINKFPKSIKGIAHITGGGIEGNLCRVLPSGLDAIINNNSWKKPECFEFMKDQGQISEAEAFHVFNMGIGMTIVINPGLKNEILSFFNKNSYKAYEIGFMEKGKGSVKLVSNA